MLFFYKSHIPIFSYTGHFKKIYNAVKCCDPNPNFKKRCSVEEIFKK